MINARLAAGNFSHVVDSFKILLTELKVIERTKMERPWNYASFILTTIVGRRPNYQLGTAAMDSVQPPILHCLLLCPHTLLVCFVNDILHQPPNTPEGNVEVRACLDRNLTYFPTLTNKEIGMIFSALQTSPPWFPYATSIVWSASRQLRDLTLATG